MLQLMINPVLKNYFLAFCFITCQIHLSGQGFKDGFIVTNDLDTISCKIAKALTNNISLSCKLDGASDLSTYTPTEIHGYGYTESRYFQSGIFPEAFVEVIIEGGINLYHLNESYFVRKGSSKLYVLEEQIDTIQEGPKTIIKISQPWKGVLNALMSDCRNRDSVQTKVTRLAERSLVRLLNNYHACAGIDYLDYKRQLPWTKFELGLTLGLQSANLQPSIRIPRFEYLENNYQFTTGQVGLYVNWSSPRILKKWSFHTGAIYSQNRFYSERFIQKDLIDDYYEFNIFLETLSIPLMIQFETETRPFSWIGQFGLFFDRYLQATNEVIRETVRQDEVSTAIEEGFEMQSSTYGYALSTGILRNFSNFRMGLLLRYRDFALISDEIEVFVEGSRFSINLILLAK
ncbi:MAG: hypothetical protein Sapg2KO_36720 [Saprospiraceae bacterium]